MSKRTIFSGAGLCLLALALPLAAQNAAVVGTVSDAQQAVITGAKVTLTNLDTGVSLTTKSRDNGAYDFPFVKPGKYSLKVEEKGFETFVEREFTVAVDDRSRVDAVLRVGESSTIITVEASAGGVQTESSGLGSVVDSKRLAEIPLNGRFFLDLALMQQGTVLPTTNNRAFLTTPSGISSSGINASGTREDSTTYMFDAIDLSDILQN